MMMASRLTWIDRLRIERVVWTLDQRLYDIPRESRLAHRREVRENLLSAAQDVGTTAALRNLGTSAQLAAAYLTVEFGDRPRHSWTAAALWAATSMLVVTAVLTDAANGFAAGIIAANPHATGTYHWGGLSLLQGNVTTTAAGGQTTVSGGGLTPAAWVLWIVITVMVGRLWRAPRIWRARRGGWIPRT
jgi:hypothetical protein